MQDRGNVYRKGILAISLISFCIFTAVAQKKPGDTTYIISSTDKQYSNLPINLSGNPYFDLIRPGQEGIRPAVLYSRDDRFFIGVNYNGFSNNWNPDSSGRKHKIFTNYSINQNAFSLGYQGIFNRLIARWNLFVDASYDWIKWMNFYGLGNETVQETNDRRFYRMQRREALLSVSLQRKFGDQSSFSVRPFYQHVKVINDEGRFLSTRFLPHGSNDIYESKHFGGIRADLQLQSLDDLLLPTKGGVLTVGVSHTRNINQPRSFTNYTAYTRLFVPFLKGFVFSLENGAASLNGEPEFFQYNSIGGSSLRGYRGERFSGETVFYNNNELQYIFDVNRGKMKGQLGFLVFGDQGRVWKKGEQSNKWHYGYGGGIMVVPYHKIYFSVQYGISHERKGLHFEFRRSL